MSTRRKHFTTLCSVVSVVHWIHRQIHCEQGEKTVNKVQQSISPSCRISQPCFMNERRLFKQTRVLRCLLLWHWFEDSLVSCTSDMSWICFVKVKVLFMSQLIGWVGFLFKMQDSTALRCVHSMWRFILNPCGRLLAGLKQINIFNQKISLEKGGWARTLRKGAWFVFCIINHLLAITILKWSATCVWNPWEDQSWFISLTQVKAMVCLFVMSN